MPSSVFQLALLGFSVHPGSASHREKKECTVKICLSLQTSVGHLSLLVTLPACLFVLSSFQVIVSTQLL